LSRLKTTSRKGGEAMPLIGKKLGIMIFAIAGLALASGTAFAGSWTLTNLNTQGDLRFASAAGINNNGDVVGQAGFAGDTYLSAALWRNGIAYNLGTLGTESRAGAINDAGIIGGTSYTNNHIDSTEAAVFSTSAAPTSLLPYTLTMQPGPLYGISDSGVADINATGQMVGQAFGGANPNHLPLLWSSDGTLQIQATLGYDAAIAGINNVGQMVGWAQTTSSHSLGHAALWSNGTVSLLSELNMGTISAASDINDSGQIVGTIFGSSGNTFATLWSDGSGLTLPGLGGDYTSANAINNKGQIVGTSRISNGGVSHAVLWEDGVAIDLNTLVGDLGLTLETAADINENGWIVGRGHTADNQQFAFLLTPDTAPVPIPATLPLFGSALAALGVLRRKFFRS
jgi:probable HAF family extracellular repeat protein